MALVRHVLRRQSLHMPQPALLAVPSAQGWPTREAWEQFGVRAQSGVAGRWLIDARPWRPTWLADPDSPVFEDVFAEHHVRLDWGRPIDPFIGEASRFNDYVSPGQREAVRSAILLPPGETLIVGLPTGSGKSFVAQAPMLIGGPEGSLSVCVVPTTALAIDQARQTGDTPEGALSQSRDPAAGMVLGAPRRRPRGDQGGHSRGSSAYPLLFAGSRHR